MTASNELFLFRPIQMSDAPALLTLVEQASGGLSSLQPRLEFLKDYIASSEKSFKGQKEPNEPHKYLMALIDVAEDRLIGCAAVKTEVGRESPFINFDLVGDGLDQYLEASSRFTGATEVGSLFLHSDYRASGLGRYLAKVRYLLIGTEPWRFGETIIAELRGICGAEGSPLYDHLFMDKLEKTFLEADAEYFDRNPDALGEIVPLGRISTSDFPLEVKASIAQTHPSGIGAMKLLQSEGFIFSGTIDLFDAGPIMSVYRDTIRTIMNSKKAEIVDQDAILSSDRLLISAGNVEDFRAVVTTGLANADQVMVSEEARKLLNKDAGDQVTYWQAPQTRRTASTGPSKRQAHV